MTDARVGGADLLADAGKALAEDDRPAAKASLAAAIAVAPAGMDAIALMIQLHLQSSAFEQAVLWLERASALDPGNVRVIEYLCLMLCQTDRMDAALRRLDRAMASTPASPPGSDLTSFLAETARVLRRYSDIARQMTVAPGFRVFDAPEEESELRLWRKALSAYARSNLQDAVRFLFALEPRYGAPSLGRLVRSDLSRLRDLILAELRICPKRLREEGKERFLIIRSHASGFCADVVHSVVQLLVARVCDRRPVVYWGRESAYADPAIDNLWDEFFEPVGTVALADLDGRDLRCFPPPFTTAGLRWSHNRPWFHNQDGASGLEIIGRDEEIAVVERFNLISEVLFVLPDDHPLKDRSPIEAIWSELSGSVKLRAGIKAEARNWLDAHRHGGPVIGFHLRLSSNDKAHESLEQARPNLAAALEVLDRFVAEHPGGRIFVMTDYQPYIDGLSQRYRGRVISRTAARLDERSAGSRQLGLGAPIGNLRLAAELVRDIATASLCDGFIGDGASNVSVVIAALGGWPRERVTWTRAPNVIGNRWAEFLTPPRHGRAERTFVVHAV